MKKQLIISFLGAIFIFGLKYLDHYDTKEALVWALGSLVLFIVAGYSSYHIFKKMYHVKD